MAEQLCTVGNGHTEPPDSAGGDRRTVERSIPWLLPFLSWVRLIIGPNTCQTIKVLSKMYSYLTRFTKELGDCRQT